MRTMGRVIAIVATVTGIGLIAGCEEPPAKYNVTVEVFEGSNYVISDTTFADSPDAAPVAVADCDEISVTGGEEYVFRSVVTWTGAQASLGEQTLEYEISPDFSGSDQRVVFSNVVIYFDDDPATCD